MMLRLNFLARHKVGSQQISYPVSSAAAPLQRMFDILAVPILLGPWALPPSASAGLRATNYSNYAIARCKEQILATSSSRFSDV